jgi:hypothetical protein
MNRRTLLKTIALLPLLSWVRLREPKKQYLAFCAWKDVVGLRLEWPDRHPNPSPGIDWEIVSLAPDCFEHEDRWIRNPRRDLFWAKPVGRKEPFKLVWIGCPWRGGIPDYSTADLRHGRFYRLV